MSKGKQYPSEMRRFPDPDTGASVRQLTDHPSIHHHPFYYVPAWDRKMRHLVLVSHRSGSPQLYLLPTDSYRLLQLTDRPDLNEWSIHLSRDGRHVYFTAGPGGWRVNTETFKEEQVLDFESSDIREKGMVGAAMGTTTLSPDDCFWAVPIKTGTTARMIVLNTATLRSQIILERDSIGHPQFHPQDSNWLRYAGPYHSRIWVMRRDGSENRLVYRRDAAKKEWIVHETWRPGSREILTTNWPHGVIAIHADTGAVRKVCAFNAWHPMVDPTGQWMVSDTKNPDLGLQMFHLGEGLSKPAPLCLTEATNAGDHWNVDHCPYDDGPVEVYAPQHTHPHPNISPDGKRVLFTSDRTGHSQLYEVDIPRRLRAPWSVQ